MLSFDLQSLFESQCLLNLLHFLIYFFGRFVRLDSLLCKFDPDVDKSVSLTVFHIGRILTKRLDKVLQGDVIH